MTKEAWLARLAIVLTAGAVVVLVMFAGPHSVGLIGFTAAGVCVTVACAYWFLARRGVVRWIAFAFAVLAPVAVAAIFATRGVLWVAIAVIAMLLAGGAVARYAMGPLAAEPVAERKAERPKRAFLIMNPRSGGGKVGQFGLRQKAESLGAEVAMLEGPGYVDVAAIAERAVADGADLLGVAGGDGTQALVAGIAAAHGLRFLCVSAGTRNHFAMDLGLDRDDPAACLDALRDGIERRIDLGLIGDRTFVNNASFGVYAEIVQSPAYRDDKRGTTLQMLPDLLRGDSQQYKLAAYVGGTKIEAPQALLVSNNAYELTDIAGLGRRDRLDGAELGVIAIKVDNAAQAIGLVRAGHGAGLVAMSSRAVTVDSPQPEIPVGIDGETVLMPTPVHCSVQPGALRVVVPRDRPGVPVPRPPLGLPTLGRLAVLGHGLSEMRFSDMRLSDIGLSDIVIGTAAWVPGCCWHRPINSSRVPTPPSGQQQQDNAAVAWRGSTAAESQRCGAEARRSARDPACPAEDTEPGATIEADPAPTSGGPAVGRIYGSPDVRTMG